MIVIRALAAYLQQKRTRKIALKYIAVVISAVLASMLLKQISTDSFPPSIHTTIELLVTALALCTSFVLLITYEHNPDGIKMLGIGFTLYGVMQILHIMRFIGQCSLCATNVFCILNKNFGTIYRMIQVTLILSTVLMYQDSKRICKWTWIATEVILAGLMVFLLAPCQPPCLYVKPPLAYARNICSGLICVLCIAGIYRIKNLPRGSTVSHIHLIIALLTIIPTEIAMVLYGSVYSFAFYLGHLLKLVYSFYLFLAIAVAAVQHPYSQLQQKEASNRDTLDSLPIGIITLDHSKKVTFTNKTAISLIGCTSEETLGRTLSEIETEQSYTPYPPTARQSIESDKPVINELVSLHKSGGNLVKVNVNTHHLDTEDTLILMQDVRKIQNVESLQLQTQTILNSLAELVVIVDTNESVVMCNRQFARTMKANQEKIAGIQLDELIEMFKIKHPKLHLLPLKLSLGCINYRDVAYDARATTLTGEAVELLIRFNPIHDMFGKQIGFIFAGTDMTTYNKEIRYLQQQEKLAVLGQMAAGIVHEIKNPLTSIKGFSQLMQSVAQDQQTQRYASWIEREADDVNHVLSDFLSFAKPNAPTIEIIDVNEIVRSLEPMVDSHAFLGGISFELDMKDSPCYAMVDPNHLKQVLLNIIQNAFEALEGSVHPRLAISTTHSPDHEYIVISISDNGTGMNEHQLSMLGTPFVTNKDKGTGLGLSICYQLIHEQNGRIEVTSKPGLGSTFTVFVPCADSSMSES